MSNAEERQQAAIKNCIEKLARDTTPDGEALNALAFLRATLKKQGKSLADLMRGESLDDEQAEEDRRLLERYRAVNDMLVTGKMVADYLKEIELLKRENEQQRQKISTLETKLTHVLNVIRRKHN